MEYNDETLKKIMILLDLMRKKGITRDIMEELIRIMSNDKRILFEFTTKKNVVAHYDTLKEKLFLKESSIISWIEKYIKQSNTQQYYPNCDYNDLLIYFLIFLLNHEINHVDQHLIGKDEIKLKHNTIKVCYKDLFDICNNKKISISLESIKSRIQLLLFYLNQQNSILERNANIEAFTLMYKLADCENNSNIKEFAYDTKQTLQRQGYLGKYNGIIEETYNKILIFKEPTYDDELSLEEKIRYGYPIDEYTKKKVLNYEYEF